MSNNIYNILGKLNSLTPKETPESVEPQKPIYKSVAAKGSVLEGVARVESKLARMFAEEKANEEMLAKKDYDGDGKKESPRDEYMGSKDKAIKKSMGKKDLDEESHGQWLAQKEKEAQSSGKSSFQAFKQTHPVDGKPGVDEDKDECPTCGHNPCDCEEEVNEGFEDLQKYMASKEKGAKQGGGAGKKQGTRYGGGLQKDDEGDAEPAADNAPKKKGRPKKDKFAESIVRAYSKNKLKEGVNFAEMMQETHSTVEEMLAELNQDIAEFKHSGHMSDKLRDCLEMHRYTKKPVVDEVVMPAVAPVAESGAFVSGRPVYWNGRMGTVDRVEGDKCFVNKPNGEMDVWPTREVSTEKQSANPLKGIGAGIKNFVMGKPEPMDEELNELAKLAGLSEAKKCNHTDKGEKCPVHGLKECGSGMYEGKKPDFLDLDKDGNKKESMKDAAKDAKKKKVDECGPGSMSPMSNMGQEEGNMSINTSMNSDGTKSVSVNATGNQADALAQMLKMAGLAAHHAVHGGEEEPKAVVIQAGPEEQVEEERDAQYANTPDEEVENVDAIMHQGNDLNREKEQYAGMPKAGDNPMATRESIEMPARISRMLEGVKQVEESKPSAGMSKGEKSALVKKAHKGGDIGKPGKSFDKVAKAAGGGEKGKRIAAAAMWKNAAK